MISRRVIDGLHSEALLLSDEARAYFDAVAAAPPVELDPLQRVRLSCESLRITTRLMHVLAWLLNQRAINEGELSEMSDARRLGDASSSDAEALTGLPEEAKALAAASMELHARIARLDAGLDATPGASPALDLLDRLKNAL